MLKALLKKQILAFTSFFLFKGTQKGKRRNVGAVLGVCALIIYAVGASAFLMWELASSMCEPFVQSGLAWVYFAFMGALAGVMGCIGSVFAAKNTLYEAKDNEALLSMPIPSWMILLSRMIGLYAITLLFTSLVFIPTVVCYFTVVEFSLAACIFCVLINFLLPLLVLSVSCLLGWLIAAITSRIASKNFWTTVLLIAFLVGYSLLMSKMSDVLTYVLTHGNALGESMRVWLFPFWQMGLAATGKPLGMLLFILFCAVAFGLVCLLLICTFSAIVTRKKTAKKAVYVEKQRTLRSPFIALVQKECRRYLKTPMILFNCGIGSIIALVFAAFALLNSELCAQISAAPISKAEVTIILSTIFCFVATSNVITASSISLEGDTLWQLRAMPLSHTTIFGAKITFHIVYSLLPITIVLAVLGALLKIPVGLILLAWVLFAVVTVFCALMGLIINLKMPNLKWTNEMVAVKQSFSVLLTMFVGWGASGVVLLGSLLLEDWIAPVPYMAIIVGLFAVATAFLLYWLQKRGGEVFENLS